MDHSNIAAHQGYETPLLRDRWCLVALIALAVNDHWLKHASFAGFVTGKISDFSGVYYFPFLLTDLWWMLGLRVLSKWRVMQIMVLVTAAVMIGIKLSAPVRLFYTHCLSLLGIHARVVPDATDLASLVMLPLALKRFRCLIGVPCVTR